MKPRHEPMYNIEEYPDEVFAGYIEEFDLYLNKNKEEAFPVTLVGNVEGKNGYNYDSFRINAGQLIPSDPQDQDLYIPPYHMCLLYAACIEHGLIEEKDSETKT